MALLKKLPGPVPPSGPHIPNLHPQSPQISHLAMLSRPALPSLIRGKLADATVSHSGDSCTQGCCDVPPGPLWPRLAGELCLTPALKPVCHPERRRGSVSEEHLCGHGDQAEEDLPTPRLPGAPPDGRTVAHQKNRPFGPQPRRVPLL